MATESLDVITPSERITLVTQMGQTFVHTDDIYQALVRTACSLMTALATVVWVRREGVFQREAYFYAQGAQLDYDMEYVEAAFLHGRWYQLQTSDDGGMMCQVYVPIVWRDDRIGVLVVGLSQKLTPSMRDELAVLLSWAAYGIATHEHIFDQREARLQWQLDVSYQIDQARQVSMSEMATAIAHQLNNPLTTILADTELLLANAKAAQLFPSLEAIYRSAKRAAEVVHRLLAVSQSGKLIGAPHPVDVMQTIEHVLGLLSSYIQSDQIELQLDLTTDKLPYVWALPDTLDDVWLNLLMNARDAVLGQKSAQIGLKTAYEPQTARIEVCVWDNGVGIVESEYEKIFSPFYTTKSSSERIGLGLHIAKKNVERVGGELRVLPRQQERGVQFVVSLPVERE